LLWLWIISWPAGVHRLRSGGDDCGCQRETDVDQARRGDSVSSMRCADRAARWNTGTTIVAFLMVFLLQNSQSRDSAVIKVKLDELIRVSTARNSIENRASHRDAEKLVKAARLQRRAGVTRSSKKCAKPRSKSLYELELATAGTSSLQWTSLLRQVTLHPAAICGRACLRCSVA